MKNKAIVHHNLIYESNTRTFAFIFALFKVVLTCLETQSLKHTELLLTSSSPLRFMRNDIELHSLGQRTALSNGHNITILDIEAGAAMSMNVFVTLLVTLVLGNVVEVIPTHDNSALHLGRDDKSLENLTTNGDITNKRTLLVDVGSLNGSIGGFDTESDILDPAHGLDLFGVDVTLAGNENGILRLIGFFVLCREPPPHDNGAIISFSRGEDANDNIIWRYQRAVSVRCELPFDILCCKQEICCSIANTQCVDI